VVGLVGLNVSYDSEIARIDKGLSSVVAAVKDAGDDKVLAAIQSAAASGTPISVGLMDSQLQVTVLAGDDQLLPSAPSSQPLVQARSKAVTVDAATHFRFRSVALSRTDNLLIASDVKAIQESRAASTTGLLAFTGSVALLSIVLIWLLIRRDLKVLQKLAQAAKDISQGNQDVQLPKFKAGNEVVLLSNSLGEMIETLESAITTERNAQRAGVAGVISFRGGDALQRMPPIEGGGVMLLNPPYGERIEVGGVAGEGARFGAREVAETEEGGAFFNQLASHWKKHFSGWSAWVLTPDLKLPGKMRLKESRRVPLWNGPIECRLFKFDLVAGRMDKSKMEPAGTPGHAQSKA
jgi:HAMP domain-containing protein